MKIARLLLVLLTLTAATLSAAPKHRHGGSQIQSTTDTAGSWYYCYATPWDVVDCGGASDEECQDECERVCGARCDWDTTPEN